MREGVPVDEKRGREENESCKGVESGEERPHALGEHVHVRKEASLLDYQIEGAVEVDHGVRIVRHCHRGGVTAG